MGAGESRSQREADEDGDNDIPTSQDYYAILEVDENAGADEIRVSIPVPRRRPRCSGCPGPASACDADLLRCAALSRLVC
jgi:hypothetical protein